MACALFFLPQGMLNLSSLTSVIKLAPRALEGEVSTTGLPGNSQ